jgi:GWxTD domain-containing protein
MISGASLTDSACDVRYTLAFAPHSSEETKQVAEENLPGLVPVRGLEALPVKIGENVGYRLVRGGNASSAFLFLGFHSDTLLLRDYRLEVEIAQGARKDKAVKRFRMVWPDMPASLRNVDYALDALRFITTESQLDSLKSGNYETRKENLEAFWKGIDRTTGGPRNAAMVEYYERVDEATKSFGTLRQPDGSKSDRGRIYVLYGPPTRTERSLDPATGFTEVWTYERVNRKFTFRDQSKTGDYALIATTAP